MWGERQRGRGRGQGGARARFAWAGGLAGWGASVEGVVVDERPLAVVHSSLWMKMEMFSRRSESMSRTTLMHKAMEREAGASSSLGIASSARSVASVASIGGITVSATMTGDWRQT